MQEQEFEKVERRKCIAKYLRLFKKLVRDQDNHYDVDSLLRDLLIELGYKRIVAEYEKYPKWYE